MQRERGEGKKEGRERREGGREGGFPYTRQFVDLSSRATNASSQSGHRSSSPQGEVAVPKREKED